MQVKAIACELPKESGQPLSRYSRQDLVREVTRRGIVAKISGRTIWRWLDEDAIRPGSIAVGSFRAIPTFKPKPNGYWISIKDSGRARLWELMTT